MLKHKFTLRELILLIIATVLALGIFYYEVILKGYTNAKSTYDTTTLEDQTSVLVLRAQKLKTMENYIEKHQDDKYGTVSVYNNLSNEVEALANVLKDADNVSINWSEPTLTDNIVRRNASVSFTTSSYSSAETIIKNINELQYKCIITSTAISDSDTSSLASSTKITAELELTFFETTDGAKTTSGLIVEDTSTSTTEE